MTNGSEWFVRGGEVVWLCLGCYFPLPHAFTWRTEWLLTPYLINTVIHHCLCCLKFQSSFHTWSLLIITQKLFVVNSLLNNKNRQEKASWRVTLVRAPPVYASFEANTTDQWTQEGALRVIFWLWGVDLSLGKNVHAVHSPIERTRSARETARFLQVF